MPATKKGARNMPFLQMSRNVTTVLVLSGLGGTQLPIETTDPFRI